MKKIYILFDCSDDRNDKKWLIDELNKLNNSENVYSVSINEILFELQSQGLIGKIKKHVIMLNQARRASRLVDTGDIVICWCHTSGLYANHYLKNKKINLISMNWLSPLKSDRKMIKFERSLATNPNAKIIVNSPESPEKWKEFLKLSNINNFFVIPDVYDSQIQFNHNIQIKRNKSCFTGGLNNRDWRLVAELASELPSISFICVSSKEDFESKVKKIPSNMDVKFDISVEEYYKLMQESSLVLLPLLDNRVAGLINIIKSAQYGIPCLVTKTKATEQYYPQECGEMLMPKDINCWKKSIENWMTLRETEYIENTKKFSVFVEKEFSPANAAKKIYELI